MAAVSLSVSPDPFDAIILRPPTAGADRRIEPALLQDFYRVAKSVLFPVESCSRLPEGDDATQPRWQRPSRIVPYIRVFRGMQGWGWHFLASERPIPLGPPLSWWRACRAARYET